MAGSGWTVDEIEKLRVLVLGGRHSASDISRALGGKYTRNAVIGKIHRLKMSLKVQQGRNSRPHTFGTSWPKPNEDTLRKLAAKGKNAAEIAKQMPGYSIRAIHNKAARLGLSITETQGGPRRSLSRYAGPYMNPVPFVPRIVPNAPSNKPVRFMKLGANDCRYEIGAPLARPEWFCGAPKRDGSAYCGFHHDVCHVKPVQVVRAAATRVVRDRRFLEAAE